MPGHADLRLPEASVWKLHLGVCLGVAVLGAGIAGALLMQTFAGPMASGSAPARGNPFDGVIVALALGVAIAFVVKILFVAVVGVATEVAISTTLLLPMRSLGLVAVAVAHAIAVPSVVAGGWVATTVWRIATAEVVEPGPARGIGLVTYGEDPLHPKLVRVDLTVDRPGKVTWWLRSVDDRDQPSGWSAFGDLGEVTAGGWTHTVPVKPGFAPDVRVRALLSVQHTDASGQSSDHLPFSLTDGSVPTAPVAEASPGPALPRP